MLTFLVPRARKKKVHIQNGSQISLQQKIRTKHLKGLKLSIDPRGANHSRKIVREFMELFKDFLGLFEIIGIFRDFSWLVQIFQAIVLVISSKIRYDILMLIC